MSPFLALMMLLPVQDDRVEIHALTAEQRKACLEYVEKHSKAPVEYLKAKFAKHQLVFLGETHQVRQSCKFVAESLAPLHGAGVHVLATEFVRSRDNAKVQRLVTGEAFDEPLALEILRDLPWPTWGFREYLEILRAAWKLNHSLPAGAVPLSVVGIDSDWEQYAMWFEIEDPAKRSRVLLERERHMAAVLEEEVLAKDRKALVHVGYAHTITCHGLRLGTVLHGKHGDKVFQVALHQNLAGAREGNPLAALLEELLAGSGGKAIAFDVVGSPLAPLYDEKQMAFRMLRGGSFASLAQGYAILAPLDALKPCTWIEGFITEQSFEKALAIAIKLGVVEKGQCASAAELDRAFAQKYRE